MTVVEIIALITFVATEGPVILTELDALYQHLRAMVSNQPVPGDVQQITDAVAARKAAMQQALQS
jgi:hypothetical protein